MLLYKLPFQKQNSYADTTAKTNKNYHPIQDETPVDVYSQFVEDTLELCMQCRCTYCLNLHDYLCDRFGYLEELTLQSTDVQEIKPTGLEPESHMSQQVNVGFSDSNPGAQVSYNPEKEVSYYDGYASGVELSKFLSRPVLINTFSLSTGVSLAPQHIAPWFDYFNDPIIKKKLDNFSLISCDLKIKVMINAAPFYYGCYLVAYQPLINESYNAAPTGYSYSNLATTANSNTRASITSLSQLQRFYIYPQSNQGGEMTLPFIYHRNWLRATDAGEFSRMGTLYIYPIVDLLNANGASGTINVQIYAWAENVKVSGPTIGLALQSSDEYGTGPVSSIASAIANASGMLTKVPVIGKYMTATSAIATGIGTVARIFGFTNPPVIDPVMGFKNLPFHGLASADISTPTEKLSLDPKNELSIDPAIVGLDNSDCMIIKDLIQREAYIGVYDWALNDTPGTLLYSTQVVPDLTVITTNTSITPNYTVRTGIPMGHVSRLFSFWKGDIIFRFKFICSKFHRGRVRVTYDPDSDITTSSTTSTTSFNQIIDISTDSDVEIRVPYMQVFPWLKTDTSPTTEYYGGRSSTYAGIGGRLLGQSNGTLTVRVFNEATAPITTAPVLMLVYVKAADNMEYAGPAELPQNLSYFALQSLDEVSYEIPTQMSMTNDYESTSNPHKFLVNHGENILSLRQLLRRTSLSRVSSTSNETSERMLNVTWTFDRRPIYYGYDPNGINTAQTTITGSDEFKNFNFSFVTPYTWVAPSFLSERGSHRWHINVDTNRPIGNMRTSRIRDTRNNYLGIAGFGVSTTNSGMARSAQFSTYAGSSGQSLTNQNTQTGVSVEAPLYSQYRMISTAPTEIVYGSPIDGTDLDTLRVDYAQWPVANGNTTAATLVYFYHGIGTDFTFLKFLRIHPMALTNLPIAG
jgi:hypothetical protein